MRKPGKLSLQRYWLAFTLVIGLAALVALPASPGLAAGPNLAAGRAVTGSIAIQNAAFITNGDKTTANYAGLDVGAQWIQIDLGQAYSLNQVNVWHYFGDGRTYHDVIVKVSTSADFSSGVTTVFNNDTNNSAGQGTGTAAEYAETSAGKTITFGPVTARYVRLWTNGSTANAYNHYVEVEVYAAGAAATSTVTRTPTPGSASGVIFYQDINYGGVASAPKAIGDYASLPADVPNDWMSSLKVPAGWAVDAYADGNFGGTVCTFTADTSWVGTACNDSMSSFKIHLATAVTPTPTPTRTRTPTATPVSTGNGSVWMGHNWNITNGGMAGVAPGSPSNVFVDASGYLHMRITNGSSGWTAAELFSQDKMGFGTYQWQIQGPLDNMDKAAVLGLFPYGPAAGIGGDGEDEIDIEFSKWNNTCGCNADFTFWPATGFGSLGPADDLFTFSLGGGNLLTARFVWRNNSIVGTVMSGLQPIGTTANVLRTFSFAPSDYTQRIPQVALPLGMNFWAFQTTPATNQEVIIRNFQYAP